MCLVKAFCCVVCVYCHTLLLPIIKYLATPSGDPGAIIAMSLNVADVEAIALALRTVPKDDPHIIHAVSLKLPTFWLSRPALWLAQVEAQFTTCQPPITEDLTKYNYVVAAGEIEALILTPPATGKYGALKAALIKAFGKTQTQKNNKLLSLSGLGDRKPSALLRYIHSLNADPKTLLRALFLAQLPTKVRQILAETDLDKLATDANRIMEIPPTVTSPHGISGISGTQRRPARSPSKMSLCYYHTRFGRAARKCHQKCSLGHLVDSEADPDTPSKVSAVGHKDKNTMTVHDCRSGRTFLVDCGGDFSVLPASASDKASLPQSDPLMAANGSPIKTWGKKKVTLLLRPGCLFTQEFYMAEVTEPILGADFFYQ